MVLYIKSYCHVQRYLVFLLLLSAMNCINLCFTFRSVIYFDLIFVKGIRSVSRFTFCACEFPVVPVQFVEKTVFAPLNCLCSFVKDQLTIFVLVFLSLYSIPLIYLSIFLTLPHCLDFGSFIIS